MPGCAAIGCNNRSEKGYIMKCFPRDPTLRKIWQERVARADWEPSNNSFLCHVHFEPQEWSITQSGRIRLKKNAVPSIFTVTSTRKSPKKRRKVVSDKMDENDQSEFSVECLENDTEHSSTGHMEEKDLDGLDIEEAFMRSCQEAKPIQLSDVKTKQFSNDVILVSDSNQTEINNCKENNKRFNESTNDLNSNTVVKAEIKREIIDQSTFEDSYDEIEENLKEICHGECTDGGNKSKANSILKKQKGKTDTSINLNYKYLSKNEIGHILTDKRENVEIIFGTVSGDEKAQVSKSILHDYTFDGDVIIKEERKVFLEDIEDNFGKDEVHVIPNMRAAMKRKRRTREEIMKSIKKSIDSDQDIHVSSNDELSDITERDTDEEKRLPECSRANAKSENEDVTDRTKFTIKVTGDPEDVNDIIHELSTKTKGRHNFQKFGSPYRNKENEAFVTTVITIHDSPIEDFKETNDSFEVQIKEECMSRSSSYREDPVSQNKISEHIKYSSSIQNASSSCKSCLKKSNFDGSKSFEPSNNYPSQSLPSNIRTGSVTPDEYDDLRETIRLQENAIENLTSQLIVYKTLESNSQSRNLSFDERSQRLNTQSLLSSKKLEYKQKMIDDLSLRVGYLEETNKKLMKKVTLESQQKRKLEWQIKQRDSRIKELNWKLEKASKYLERAEKNANAYRRKMLNMQTIIRRKQLLDERMTRFNEILLSNTKNKFSETGLTTAMEIKKACGRSGYEKLLSYGFPLPPLSALRKRFLNDYFSDNDNREKATNDVPGTMEIKIENIQDIKSEAEVDTKDSGIPESDAKETELEGAEAITGTVHDIFDENNDAGDHSTNKLKEHFPPQLNAVV